VRLGLVALWIVVGVAVWNGVFDLYVSRGAREYGQKAAEADLGLGPRVTMAGVMAGATHDGLVAASLWAVAIVICGWLTVWIAGRPPSPTRRASARLRAVSPPLS
jgi:hypothetical protein